jgi:3-hydroxyisobutyrate dehydrogenase-like beta-hydroxyacid dehydrogenase
VSRGVFFAYARTPALKDARLMLEEAWRVGQPLPPMEINTALLAATTELGGPERDSSAVIEAIRARLMPDGRGES